MYQVGNNKKVKQQYISYRQVLCGFIQVSL